MSIFSRRRTPSNSVDRISALLNQVEEVQHLLDSTPDSKGCTSDWNANKSHAQSHLTEARNSLEAALGGLTMNQHRPTTLQTACEANEELRKTRGELRSAQAEVNRLIQSARLAEARIALAVMDGVALKATTERLSQALALAEARAAAAEVRAAEQHAQALDAVGHARRTIHTSKALADKMRKFVMGAIHPDKSLDAQEREWRTKLCQALFPELERMMSQL